MLHKNRFWKEEGLTSDMFQHSKGKSIENVPVWISVLINKNDFNPGGEFL